VEKQILLISRIRDEDSVPFISWLLHGFAEPSFAADRDLARCVINIPHRDQESVDGFDAVAEIWGSGASLSRIYDRLLATGRLERCLRYGVVEWVEKGGVQPSGVSPGIKVIGCVAPHAHLDPGQVKAYWDQHVPLALDIHIGISRYVRNWVTGPDPGGPNFFGFPMLYFPTLEDFRDRYFRSAEAKRLHAADVGQFVGSGVRLETTEHVFARD